MRVAKERQKTTTPMTVADLSSKAFGGSSGDDAAVGDDDEAMAIGCGASLAVECYVGAATIREHNKTGRELVILDEWKSKH
jgi:hypothetical protein